MSKRINSLLYFFIGLLGFKSNSAMAAVNMFLCDGSGVLAGESKDPNHTGCIDVLAWSWGVQNDASFHVGGTGGAGRVSMQDISLTKWVDKATPILLESVAKGVTFPKLELSNHRACCDTEYIRITMDKVLVTSVSTGGSGSEDRLTENVSLNFAKVTYCYWEPDGAEGPGPMTCFSHDISSEGEFFP
jgi:type VI secretion system secreted protein Hcp